MIKFLIKKFSNKNIVAELNCHYYFLKKKHSFHIVAVVNPHIQELKLYCGGYCRPQQYIILEHCDYIAGVYKLPQFYFFETLISYCGGL